MSGVYGPSLPYRFNTAGCSVSVAHTQVQCLTSYGSGTNLPFYLTVGGQQSAASSQTLSYTPPSITGINPNVAIYSGGPLLATRMLRSRANACMRSRRVLARL